MTRETHAVHIRDARAGEAAAVAALTMAAYAQYEQLMEPRAWAALRQALQGALAAPGALAHLVAEQGGELVGSVLLFPAAGDGAPGSGGRMRWPELRLLAVAPQSRGHGVGRALVEACIERARAAGAPAIGLYSSGSMQAALALYEAMGFVRVPEQDFQPAGAELIMAYCLPLA